MIIYYIYIRYKEPQMFDLKVGFTCNNKCIHCVVEGKKSTKDLTLEEIKDIVNRVPEREGIVLTGGEVSIRKDFYDIVKYCFDKGHKVCIQTNGTGFTKELTEKIAPYLSQVLIAIHSCNEDIHNKIVQCKGPDSMYKKTMEGFKNLIEAGVNLETQTVISTLNIKTLYDTYSMIQKMLPMCFMHLTYPHPMGGAYDNHEIVCPKYSNIKKYILPIVRDFGTRLVVEAIPPCYLHPWYQSIEILMDSEIKRGSLCRKGFDKSISESNETVQDYNKNDVNSKRKGPLCSECAYNYECIGVWKEYLEFYRDNCDLYPVEEIDDNSINRVYIKLSGATDQFLLNQILSKYKYEEIIPYGNLRSSLKTLNFFNYKYIRPYVLTEKNLYLLEEFKDINLHIEKDTHFLDFLIKNNYKNNFYVDFDILNRTFEEVEPILNKLSQLNIGYCRIFRSKGENIEDGKESFAILNKINKIRDNYPYQILFVNAQNCNFDECTYLIQTLRDVYIEITNKIIENKIDSDLFKTKCCLNCTFDSRCFGFKKGGL